MLKVLSFLGLGPPDGYKETTYIKHDGSGKCKTHLFPEAVTNLYEPKQTVVFVTPLVRKNDKGYLEYLRMRLGSQFCPTDIPNGNSPTELWKIFNVCEKAVDEGDEIILDITHAFRSLPLLTFTVSVYLRQVKQVKLKRVIYGAFEAQDKVRNETPIFDLTPFIALLDWTNAINIFQCSGDARPIAALPDVPRNISDGLRNLSAALLTNCTLRAQEAAFRFNSSPLGGSTVREPIQALITDLQLEYSEIGLERPELDPQETLKTQCKQIKWYFDHQHYLQAVMLIREWLVSWEYLQEHPHSPRNWLQWHGHRENAELQFTKPPGHSDLEARGIWRSCHGLRNELAHCGIRAGAIGATAAIRRINNLYDQFENFAKREGFVL